MIVVHIIKNFPISAQNLEGNLIDLLGGGLKERIRMTSVITAIIGKYSIMSGVVCDLKFKETDKDEDI